MANCEVFQGGEEINRLAVQNKLLGAYEQPIYQRIFSEYPKLRVLDVGCNNGSKTVERFENTAKVIGLEYHSDLAAEAQKNYGNDVFSFYQCDVEKSDFSLRLASLMTQSGVDAFDIIQVSFVLMHLKNPGILLVELRRFLTPNGRLIVVEANDSVSKISPDDRYLFRGFLNILTLDPFSGDRNCGAKTPALLTECGYKQITLENTKICADEGEAQKKQDIFTVFFSYLPQDVLLLQRREQHNTRYAEWNAWLEQHFDELKTLILSKDTKISMGISIITCFGG